MIRRIAALAGMLAVLMGGRAEAQVKQGATPKLMFQMVSATDGSTGITGLTPTVVVSKAGGAFAAGAGAVAEVPAPSYGWYTYTPAAAETATAGDLALRATGAGAYETDRLIPIVAYDPADAAALGLSRLDATISSRTTGAVTLAVGQVVGSVTNPVTLPASPPAGYGGGGGAAFIPAGAVVAGSTTTSVVVSGLAANRNFVGQHLYHQSGESRLIAAAPYASGNYTFTFTATALLSNAFSAIAPGETVKPTP